MDHKARLRAYAQSNSDLYQQERDGLRAAAQHIEELECKLESFEAFMRAYDEWIGDVLAQPYAEPGVMLDKRIRLKAVVDRARAALSDE